MKGVKKRAAHIDAVRVVRAQLLAYDLPALKAAVDIVNALVEAKILRVS